MQSPGKSDMNGQSDNRKPRHIASAEMLAKETDFTGSELLHRIQATALSPDYPTAECFLPTEVWDYERTGTMPQRRLAHRDECVNCRALLAVLTPDPALTDEFAAMGASQYRANDKPRTERPRENRRTYAATVGMAAVIVFGVVFFSWHPLTPHSSNAPNKLTPSVNPQRLSSEPAQFVVTNQTNNFQLSVPVKTYADGRLQEKSYAAAAAATALASGPDLKMRGASGGVLSNIKDQGHVSVDPSVDQLRRRLVSALAYACEAPRKQGITRGEDVDALDVKALEDALKGERLQVRRVSSSNDELLVKYGSDSVTLQPNDALSSTMQYCKLLDRHRGDTRALDDGVRNVVVRMDLNDASLPK